MAKRFTATDKWEDVWFSGLSNPQKLFWIYLLDKCDSAGIWEKNFNAASFFLGFKIAETDCDFLEGKVFNVNGSKWFIPNFIDFQYGELTPNCKPHIPILKTLERYNLKGYPKGINTPNTRQDKTRQDKDKDKDNITEEQMQNLWLRTFSRNPKIPEMEETELLVKRFGMDKVFEIYKKASLKGFKNLGTLIEALDSDGNILDKDGKLKQPKQEHKMSAEMKFAHEALLARKKAEAQ